MESKKQTPASPAKHSPSHVFLLERSGDRLAGAVLPAHPDVISALDLAGAKYREATAQERAIAGFTA